MVVGYKANRAVVPPAILRLADIHVDPVEGHDPVLEQFRKDYQDALDHYDWWLNRLKDMWKGEPTIVKKRANEAARAFLPNASETRLVWTMNARAARWIIEQRGDVHADLEIRRLACAFTRELKYASPLIFADAEVYTAEDGFEAVRVTYSKP